jgi:EpsI family protein
MNPRMFSIVLFVAALAAARIPGAPIPAGEPEKRLSTFPMELEGWKGKDDPFDSKVMAVVGTDDDLHRIYRKGDSYLWLYVGYYGTRKGGRTGHMPNYCYPAAGYRVVTLEKLEVPGLDGRTERVNHLVLERKGQMTSTLYWIHSGEHRVLTDGWMMNMTRLRRRLMDGRDDGALVRISGPVQGSLEQTVERQRRFAQEFLETVPTHWPLETEAQNLQRFAQLSGKHEKS